MKLFKEWRNSVIFAGTGDEAAPQHFVPAEPYLISIVTAQPKMNCNFLAWMLQKYEVTRHFLILVKLRI